MKHFQPTRQSNRKKVLAVLALGLFVVTGTYNAVVINSESHISSSDIKFVKRLDEVYGVVQPGRLVAASIQWQKLSIQQAAIVRPLPAPLIQRQERKVEPAVAENQSEAPALAAVQEELSLNLAEVINPKKYQQGLTSSQFSGSLSTNNGVIEALNVSLPNGEGVSVSFSEMTGNVFEYDLDGEVYSGMMYQVDQGAYMVTLTNGPLEGTRLKFSGAEAVVSEPVQAQEVVADTHIPVGNFGEELNQAPAEVTVNPDQQMQAEAIQAQGFNFEQQAL